MEYLVLMDGTRYRLATNGFLVSETKVELKLITEDAVEQVSSAFSAENTAVMRVVNESDATLNRVTDFVRRGNVISKMENAVINVKVIHEVTDEEGNIVVPAGIEEETGTVIAFAMYPEKVEDKVRQNRADIDYLLMMEDA